MPLQRARILADGTPVGTIQQRFSFAMTQGGLEAGGTQRYWNDLTPLQKAEMLLKTTHHEDDPFVAWYKRLPRRTGGAVGTDMLRPMGLGGFPNSVRRGFHQVCPCFIHLALLSGFVWDGSLAHWGVFGNTAHWERDECEGMVAFFDFGHGV